MSPSSVLGRPTAAASQPTPQPSPPAPATGAPIRESFLRRHPLLGYCAVVFALSWGGILLLVGPGAVPVDAEHLVTLIGLGYVGMLAGPSLAGVLLTALRGGTAGLRELRSRLLRWRVGAGWYAVALLTAPLSILAVLLALALAAQEFVPRLVVEEDRFALVQFSVVSALLVGVFEELGWTGFAVPTLLGRGHGVLRTGLAVGLLYAAWNFLIVYLREASGPTPGTLPLALYLAVGLFTWQPAYRVLMVWASDRTRSLLLAMLMQTSLVAAWTSLTPLALTRTTLAVFYIVLTGVWCGIAVLAVVRQSAAKARDAAGLRGEST